MVSNISRPFLGLSLPCELRNPSKINLIHYEIEILQTRTQQEDALEIFPPNLTSAYALCYLSNTIFLYSNVGTHKRYLVKPKH